MGLGIHIWTRNMDICSGRQKLLLQPVCRLVGLWQVVTSYGHWANRKSNWTIWQEKTMGLGCFGAERKHRLFVWIYRQAWRQTLELAFPCTSWRLAVWYSSQPQGKRLGLALPVNTRHLCTVCWFVELSCRTWLWNRLEFSFWKQGTYRRCHWYIQG